MGSLSNAEKMTFRLRIFPGRAEPGPLQGRSKFQFCCGPNGSSRYIERPGNALGENRIGFKHSGGIFRYGAVLAGDFFDFLEPDVSVLEAEDSLPGSDLAPAPEDFLA